MTKIRAVGVFPLHVVLHLFLIVAVVGLQGLIAIAWFMGVMFGVIARTFNADTEEFYLEVEEFGVTASGDFANKIAPVALWLGARIYQFFAAHQALGILCLLFFGVPLLYPLVRVVTDGRTTKASYDLAVKSCAFPGLLITQCRRVAICLVCVAVLLSALATAIALIAGAFVFSASILLEQKGVRHAWAESEPIAHCILSGAIGGAWEFVSYLPGFASRHPLLAASSLVIVLIPISEFGAKSLFHESAE